MKRTRRSILTSLLLIVAAMCLLFAACGSGSVKLYFETNGGETIESVALEKGEEYTLPTPVWDDAHSFEGWYTDAECTGTPVTTVTAETNATFYAKWETLAEITLDLGGGTLSGASGGKLYLKAGESLYNFMENRRPTKQDHEFGEWLFAGSPLARGATMPAEGITLTARYKVSYTVEVYLQNLDDLNTYERGEDIVGYEYAGGDFLPQPDITGFTPISHDGASSAKVLSENAQENTFALYFDRMEYAVVLMANYPNGAAAGGETSLVLRGLYGEEIEFPVSPFEIDGYCLVGWSTKAAGSSVDYRSGYIASLLYNGTYEYDDTYTVESDAPLYAVWSRGYTNLFEGEDYIFHLEADSRDVYLLRGGMLFLGTYNPASGLFTFTALNSSGTVLLQGRLYENGTYLYYSDSRDGFAYTLYELGTGLSQDVTIHLDGYNGITYFDRKTNESSEGTYYIDENKYYVVTFTSGPMLGTWTFALGSVEVDGVRQAAFQIRNDEEYSWGAIYRGGVVDGGFGYYNTSVYSITLNGFGTATFVTADSEWSYNYLREGDVIRLVNSKLETVLEVHLMEILGKRTYMLYNEDLDATFTSSSGETLTPDGLYGASYTNAQGTVVEGIYTVYSSKLGNLVYFYANGEEYIFLTNTEKQTIYDEEGKTSTVVTRNFERKAPNYGEYYYWNEEGVNSYLLVVMNADGEGTAAVYGYTSSKTYVKVLEGVYVYDETTERYLFTANKTYDAEVKQVGDINLAEVKAFSFKLGVADNNSVVYWYAMTTQDGGDASFERVYRGEDGATLILVNGYATYTDENGTVMGVYSVSKSGIVTLSTSDGNSLYFLFDEDAETFEKISALHGTVYELLADGTATTKNSLALDGKGGAVYTVKSGAAVSTYEGAYEQTSETTMGGYYLFQFKSDELSFTFIFAQDPVSSNVYFARYNETVNGTYSSDVASLTLDGFSYMAVYQVNGRAYYGYYSLVQDDVVRLETSAGYVYFDLKSDRTFTVRDNLYGVYFLIDNQYMADNVLLGFDGYGNLTLFTFDENQELVESGTGSYAQTEDGNVTLEYERNNEAGILVGVPEVIQISSNYYLAFYVIHNEVVTSYVNERDLSVLRLDNHGGAMRFTSTGSVEYGSYVLIAEDLLYYVNLDGTNACIYRFDREKGNATPSNYTERAYYTSDLEALLFSSYGFMIMDGVTRYYYTVDAKGNVTIYRQDPSDVNANDYGFVEENFGFFEDTKIIDGKTYFASDGYRITFQRAGSAEEQAKFPVPVENQDDRHPLEALTFAPTGAKEFNVSGQVFLDGKNWSCDVVRTVDKDGTVQMYVKISSFRFDIEVDYNGDDSDGSVQNTYRVTAMRTESTYLSFIYLYNYVYYSILGYTLNNNFGYITIGSDYDESGAATGKYISGEFGTYSGMVDTNGNLVSIDHCSYDYDEETRVYTVEITAGDGLTYRMYFALQNLYYYIGVNMSGYVLYAFTLVESFDTQDGYTLETERIVATDSSAYGTGSYFNITLKKNGEELQLDTGYLSGGNVYYFVRTKDDDGKITGSVLYFLEFTESVPAEGENHGPLNPRLSVTVTERKMSVAYSEDGETYVEYDEDGIILLKDGYTYLVQECEKNEDGTYTVTTSAAKYTVKIENGVVTITREQYA